jgi:hypothetical protein
MAANVQRPFPGLGGVYRNLRHTCRNGEMVIFIGGRIGPGWGRTHEKRLHRVHRLVGPSQVQFDSFNRCGEKSKTNRQTQRQQPNGKYG